MIGPTSPAASKLAAVALLLAGLSLAALLTESTRVSHYTASSSPSSSVATKGFRVDNLSPASVTALTANLNPQSADSHAAAMSFLPTPTTSQARAPLLMAGLASATAGALLLVWGLLRRGALRPLEPLHLAAPVPAAHTMLNVLGEPFDSDEQRMEAIKRVYLDGDAFILDVRTREEVAAEGTLAKAVNIPIDELEAAEDQLPPFRDTPILVYCKSGYRSGIAEQILVEMEYFDVLNGGGFQDIAFLDLYALYKDKRTFVIDVRRPDEVAEGTLARATNIEFQLLPEFADRLPQNKDAPIMVFCKLGQRSEKGRQILREMGYTNVTNAGGYPELKFFDA